MYAYKLYQDLDTGDLIPEAIPLCFRSDFPAPSEKYTLSVSQKGVKDGPTKKFSHSVGRYFTEAGEFHRIAFQADIAKLVAGFEKALTKAKTKSE